MTEIKVRDINRSEQGSNARERKPIRSKKVIKEVVCGAGEKLCYLFLQSVRDDSRQRQGEW